MGEVLLLLREDVHAHLSLPGGLFGCPPGKKTVAELDQEIDFLRTVLREQEVTAVQPEAPEVAAVITADISSVLHDDNNKKIFLDAISSGASPRVTNASAAPPPPAPPPSRGPVTAAPPAPGTRGPERRLRPVGVPVPGHTDSLTIIIISVCVVMGTVFLMVTTFCVLRLKKGSHMTQKVSYPAFRGSPAPTVTVNGTTMGDKNLAQSAQMYHYQHHKQQMMSMGKHRLDRKTTESEITSDEEDVGGDFTVYECPGLAPVIHKFTVKRCRPISDEISQSRPVIRKTCAATQGLHTHTPSLTHTEQQHGTLKVRRFTLWTLTLKAEDAERSSSLLKCPPSPPGPNSESTLRYFLFVVENLYDFLDLSWVLEVHRGSR
ncbi:hypothetical protein NHX12_027336 [Muraenolepis orangiensis]|uniref:Neural proliferation differentiation and control protein 1 n=1 Tax=Muraenolepis orangiensis TaxID=630683 RepID=A0A9Q0EEF3_9TELE|nr:hypothetical protein NHX12_027336 [Muraenolepis orangiensis]